MELTGNVHFEGVIIFFVLLAFLFFLKNNWQSSAICLGFGIASKLIPVLFAPLIVYKLGWKKGLLYSLITALTTLIIFAFAFDVETIENLLNSANLFVKQFEFNASI